MADSVLIQEPLVAAATSEVATIALGTGPQGKPLHSELATERRDTLGDSVDLGGTQNAPAAATVIVTITPGAAGVWEAVVTLSIQGNPADMPNCELKKNSTVIAILATGLSPTFRKTLAATDTLSVAAIANASAGSVYTATISAKQVN